MSLPPTVHSAYIRVQASGGADLFKLLRDALQVSLQNEMPVYVKHNDKTYLVSAVDVVADLATPLTEEPPF